MNTETQHYSVRIARVFEKYPQVVEACTESIEDVGLIMSMTGFGDTHIQIKEYQVKTFYCGLSKKPKGYLSKRG